MWTPSPADFFVVPALPAKPNISMQDGAHSLARALVFLVHYLPSIFAQACCNERVLKFQARVAQLSHSR